MRKKIWIFMHAMLSVVYWLLMLGDGWQYHQHNILYYIKGIPIINTYNVEYVTALIVFLCLSVINIRRKVISLNMSVLWSNGLIVITAEDWGNIWSHVEGEENKYMYIERRNESIIGLTVINTCLNLDEDIKNNDMIQKK